MIPVLAGLFPFACGMSPAPERDSGPAVPVPRDRGIDREAARAALDWLVAGQHPDGSWDPFEGHERWPGSASEYARRMIALDEETALVCIAGIGFLAAGGMEGDSPYAAPLDRCVRAVLVRTNGDGGVGGTGSNWHAALAAIFLAEVEAVRPDPGRRIVLGRLRDRLLSRQRGDGGWGHRYPAGLGTFDTAYMGPEGEDLVAATLTALASLASIRQAGVEVPGVAVDRAFDYLARCTDDEGRVAYSLARADLPTPEREFPARTLDAFAVAFRFGREMEPVPVKWADYAFPRLEEIVRGHDGPSFHYLFGTLALHARGDREASIRWIRAPILAERNANGSFGGRFPRFISRHLATAIRALVLQLGDGRLLLERTVR